MRTNSHLLPLLFLLIQCSRVQGVAECMSGNRVKCFDCHSKSDPRCLDPFNWTTLPHIARCDGCCVKMVRGIGTPSYQVERTCTSELQINLFMVDHVCMSESNQRGKLCFCEEDLCNQTTDVCANSIVLCIILAVLQAATRLTMLL